MNLTNKYATREVFDIDLLDTQGNLIVRLDTLQGSDIIFAKSKTYIKIVDALVDMDFITHVQNNKEFIYSLNGETQYRNANSGCDVNARFSIKQAKLIRANILVKCEHCLPVTMIFEVVDGFKYGMDMEFVQKINN